jgi:hypothetical protein
MYVEYTEDANQSFFTFLIRKLQIVNYHQVCKQGIEGFCKNISYLYSNSP